MNLDGLKKGKDGRTIGQRIGYIREMKGLTQQSLADVMSVPRTNVRNWENDQREVKYETIVALTNALDVSADYLLGLSDNPTRDESIDGACRCTGLSQKAVQYLRSVKESGGSIESVSSILEAKQFHRLIKELDGMAFSLDQLSWPIEFLSGLNEPEPEPTYEKGPDGNLYHVSGDDVVYSRMLNAQLDLKEHLTELRVQLFELSKLWPEFLEEIMPTEETVSAGKDLCEKFNIR